MAIKMKWYALDDVKKINFTSQNETLADVTTVILNNSIVWAKQFTLVLNVGDGVDSVEIRRLSKTEPSAPDTIKRVGTSAITTYYGEYIQIEPKPKQEYNLIDSWPKTIKILENTSISVNATTTSIKLVAPIIIDGGIGEVDAERRFSIYANMKNPNSNAVTAHCRLFNVKSNIIKEEAQMHISASSNSSVNVSFDDYSSTYGYKQWADPSVEYDNGALIAARFIDFSANDDIDNSPSDYVFWSNKIDVTAVNNSNNKISSPTVSATYTTTDSGYTLFVQVTETWPFSVNIIFETPNGIYDSTSSEVSGRQLTLPIDSMDGVVKVHLVDSSRFGFRDSDIISFNIADASQISSSSEQ